MDTDATALTLPNRDNSRAHWMFWESGLLAALAAIIATPAESNHQAVYGIVFLLFLMGLANHGRAD
jgi:hypothetical protein